MDNTGSSAHMEGLHIAAAVTGVHIVGGELRRGARKVAVSEEEDVYAALSLPWIPPELRESGRDEILAAADGRLPRLVAYDDVRGCFHCHTTASDGKATLDEMAEGALARGWRYLGIADHSQAAGYAGGLSPADIARQHDAIDAWNDSRGHELWLFKGIEADILADGELDYAALGETVLGTFDYVVGSVHSGFGMPRAQMTRRVLRALQNPFITFLGHPTGRLLLIREGYAIDLDEVVAAAADRRVGIEINCDPHRMEMDWRHWREAKAKGVATALNPDAHSVRELDNVRLGTTIARKGWLETGDVVNTWELDEVRAHFARKGSRWQ
jgi:DNA polymerase (family 10)